MDTITITKDDEIVMKLLHYFITEQGYNPIILQGAKNEIWLENLDSSYKVVRIVSNYIHNDEQFNFDLYKTKQILKKIRVKTLSLKMNTISIFVNLGDNVHVEEKSKFELGNMICLDIKNIKDLEANRTIEQVFPDIAKNTNFKEKGIELFMKITTDINKKNEKENKKAEDVFTRKTPYITYGLIGLNILMFLLMYMFGNGSEDSLTLLKFGACQRDLVVLGDYFRLITCSFLHIGVFHLIFNMYALYIIGAQLENFFGKVKYLGIYLGSAVFGSLLSILFSGYITAGASGSIFGLLGALLYFGYHYRIYLGSVLRSQIIPLIVANLLLGFIVPGVDVACHIGGLIGGVFLSMALGVKHKSTKSDQINGFIISLLFLGFLIYMNFMR